MRSLARLWPWVRPIRSRLVAATVLAAVASVLALLMPLVLKWVADGPVAHRDPAGVWLGGGLLLVLGAAEAGIFGVRRWLVARPLAGIEAGMRQAFYRHVQRLPVAAHERWSSGQLLSRSTTDLQLLHGFLAVALPFLVVNAVAQVADGTVSAGTLLAFVAIALALKPSVDSTGELLAVSNEAAGAADRYLEVMDTPAAIDQPTDDPPAPLGWAPAGLVFDQIRFRYPGRPAGSPDILDGLSLRIEPGESVALVGASPCTGHHDGPDRGAPALDRPARRPGRPAVRWPDRRYRNPSRTAENQPRIRGPHDAGGDPLTAAAADTTPAGRARSAADSDGSVPGRAVRG